MLPQTAHAVSVKYHDLTGKDIADEFRAHGIERTALGSDHISAVLGLAVAQGTEAVFVPRRNQLGGRSDDQRICTPNAVHGTAERLFNRSGVEPFLGYDIRDDFGVACGVEDGAFQLQRPPQFA